jgi:hypothetical protein
MNITRAVTVPQEDYLEQLRLLKKTFPPLQIEPQVDATITGVLGKHVPVFIVFYNYKVAFAENPYCAEVLQGLGYEVGSERFNSNHLGDNEFYLWSHLQKTGAPIIEQKIEELLLPIIQSTETDELEFAVYSPGRVSCSDRKMEYQNYEELFVLKRPFDFSLLRQRLKRAHTSETLALSSRMQGKQLPFVDFSTEYAPKGKTSLKNAMQELHLPDRIPVNSGNSFHHYGQQLLKPQEYYAHLRSLKEHRSVGPHWPDLQMYQGFSLLRIAPSGLKPFFPEVLKL